MDDAFDSVATPPFLGQVERHIDIAFQPIVNTLTGACYAVEALLRGHETLGFTTPFAVFDYAQKLQILHQMDLIVREKAIRKFSTLGLGEQVKMFFNLDNRILNSPDYQMGATVQLLERHGLPPYVVCFEISERHDIAGQGNINRILDNYKAQSFRLAIDDFGTGFSGMKLLYERNPDYIKIDRFFISGISRDSRKKLFLTNIVNLAHVLGILVIAEGVETEEEFLTCKEIGCDLVQGFLIKKPTTDAAQITSNYSIVEDINRRDRRKNARDDHFISERIERLPIVRFDAPMEDVFQILRQNKNLSYFPVLDAVEQPIGLIRENDIKELSYSPYGKDLMANRAYGKKVQDFITPCPIVDIRTSTDRVLEFFSMADDCKGVLITDNSRYVGFLTATSLLRAINEMNLACARDQNPLSKLPGNNMIANFVANALDETERNLTLVYFDFDNFKPFNDTYGFRQGDRAIVLFSDLMRKTFNTSDTFLGHIGGDDFFVGVYDQNVESVAKTTAELRDTFSHNVESFYDPDDRRRGHIVANDRHGVERHFDLLTISAAVLHLPHGVVRPSFDKLSERIAAMKKNAKKNADGIDIGLHAIDEAINAHSQLPLSFC